MQNSYFEEKVLKDACACYFIYKFQITSKLLDMSKKHLNFVFFPNLKKKTDRVSIIIIYY